jgi:hypothetical protein
MLLWGADQSRYLKLMNNLLNNMTKEANNFPKTTVETLQLVSSYKVPARAQQQGWGLCTRRKRDECQGHQVFLFKWNDTVDEQQEGLVGKDLVPYPLLVAEFLGVTLDHDTPAIKDKIIPQGRAEDAAEQHVNLALLNIVAGVDGPAIINTQNDKIGYNGDDDNGIIAVANINQGGAPQLQPIIEINNTDNNDNTDNSANDGNNDTNNSDEYNDSSNNDDVDKDSIGDANESIKTYAINFDQGSQNDDENDDKNETMKLLECADPSARTKGNQIGFPTTAYTWQQDNKQEQVCAKPPFEMVSCSSQPQT